MNNRAATWPMGAGLELIQACIFPTALPDATDLTQPFTADMINTSASLKLWPGERAQFIRSLGTTHILCHHSTGQYFISRTERFQPIL